jgi:hypothetical protein
MHSSEAEVRDFWTTLETVVGPTAKCVVKPNESAGTDSVFLCQNVDEAIVAFNRIHGQFNGLGHINHGALCQVPPPPATY